MDLKKLRYFYTVATTGHLTAAAELLYISQPSLTQAIHTLEEDLGVPLFEKKGRGLRLTPYGDYLKQQLDRLLPEFDRLPSELSAMRSSMDRTVKLNILAASTFVINAIVGFRKKNPDVIFAFEQNERRGDCDIVVTTNGFPPSDAQSLAEPHREPLQRCIKEEKIYLAVPSGSRYAAEEAVDLRTVREERFVMLSGSRLFGNICTKFCAGAGFYPNILFESDSPMAVQSIIGTGSGIAFWPEYSWGKVQNRSVVLRPISNPICQRELIFELYGRTEWKKVAAPSGPAEAFYRYLLRKF